MMRKEKGGSPASSPIPWIQPTSRVPLLRSNPAVVAADDKALTREGLIACLLHRFNCGIEGKVPADNLPAEYIDNGKQIHEQGF
jgi:hypothetical protein